MFSQELAAIFKRATWSVKWATTLLMDLIFQTDEKTSPETHKEKLGSVKFRRSYLCLQFLTFTIFRSNWARREICESVDTLRDIVSYLPALYKDIISYAYKKRVRPVPELEMTHLWRCKLRFGIVEELNRWAEHWSDNKYLRLALQYSKKKGFKKGSILSGEEVLRPKAIRKRPRPASALLQVKMDPKFSDQATKERLVLDSLDSRFFLERVESILEKSRQSLVVIVRVSSRKFVYFLT